MITKPCKLCRLAALFAIGGLAYVLVELLWRGHSHISMFVVGGLCFVLIGSLNEYYPWSLNLLTQMALSALIVTAVELVAGLILNVRLGLDIWDYSDMPLNLWGQVCPTYTFAWFGLSFPAIFLDDWLRWKLFGEEPPHYHLI